jgi:hypothetical protein
MRFGTWNVRSLCRVGSLEIGCEDADWTNVAQGRHRWRTFVNTVMNLQIPDKAGNFLTN